MSDYDEALVEKAAEALAHAYGDEAHVAEYHDEARAVLDAVAPTIRADAWDEGHEGCDCSCHVYRPNRDCVNCANPYREVTQ